MPDSEWNVFVLNVMVIKISCDPSILAQKLSDLQFVERKLLCWKGF